MKSKESLFSRDFWLLAAVNLFVMISYYSLMVTIGPYALTKFHTATSISGLIVGVTVIGILIARFSSGWLTHHFDNKILMIVGGILLVPTTLLYQVLTGVGMLLIVRLFQGLAIGLISTVTNTAVVLLFPKNRTGEGIGFFSLSTILATAIGPFLGLLLQNNFGYNLLFASEIILSLIALGLTFMVNRKSIAFHFTDTHSRVNIRDFVEPKALPIAMVIFIVGLSYAAIQAYMSFYTTAIELSVYASYFFLVYAVAILLSRPLTGRIVDRHGANWIVIPAAIIEMVGLIILATAHSGIALMLSAFLIGLGFGNFQSTAQTVVAKCVPITRLSQATSTYFIFFDLSLGLGPYLLGLLEPSLGYRWLFGAMALIVIFGLLVYLFKVKPVDHSQTIE
ncbi:hypothetical protein FC70_GL001255 [Paucilactobacillus oligofermentans DSM 15707 = LMG 22743]|uniref:Major facilitator superfamily (MFS) profile domain-containing protein n=1 Tax=Paucilactobacillus oligofermentans DSM 15707 = LMG 22743 TaxID=1423778 RepID=A0A0R1RKC2_9LACO|nr:MFS transporter [Paucilactobacillus oligofermentans]KRL55652.1 hypothetical protein FC70_GL001255 [Paucilactobacillus oligofermentans DSM 15707 = LMG 22743]CUS25359.1 Uncharacterized MFS-type transporter YwoG [Paucilactobacillus oligofermentans DSM 15707 = LMG 22743]